MAHKQTRRGMQITAKVHPDGLQRVFYVPDEAAIEFFPKTARNDHGQMSGGFATESVSSRR